MKGIKLHRRGMVRNLLMGMADAMSLLERGDQGLRILCSVLRKVRQGGGGIEEEDDGYYNSSDDEGVTAEMAERGVGEAGRVVVAESIWKRLVPADLLRAYKRAQKNRGAANNSAAPKVSLGPVDSMLEALRVDTGGLHRTKAPPHLPHVPHMEKQIEVQGDPRRPRGQ